MWVLQVVFGFTVQLNWRAAAAAATSSLCKNIMHCYNVILAIADPQCSSNFRNIVVSVILHVRMLTTPSVVLPHEKTKVQVPLERV